MYVYMYLRMYMYVCICICMYKHVYVCLCTYICVYTIYTCLHVCMYIYIYIFFFTELKPPVAILRGGRLSVGGALPTVGSNGRSTFTDVLWNPYIPQSSWYVHNTLGPKVYKQGLPWAIVGAPGILNVVCLKRFDPGQYCAVNWAAGFGLDRLTILHCLGPTRQTKKKRFVL